MYNQGVTRSLTRTRLVPFGQACVLSALIVSLSWFLRASDLGSSTAGVKPLEAIGWKLFFDKILSGPGNFSCGSCHLPEKGYEGGVALAKGAHNDVLPRSTPTVVNLKEATAFFWDGRALSLEEQAKGPITSEIEMDLNLNEAEARIRADPAYRKAFAAAGVAEVGIGDILGALAAFERRLVTGETPYDRWLTGDRSALTESQERGRLIFFGTGQCAVCHSGSNFTDGDFHNIGTGTPDDVGRYSVTNRERDKGAFKTPSLRNWKNREPFMHDGRFSSMGVVLDHYSHAAKAQVGHSEVDPLYFTDTARADLTAFMTALNGPWPDLEPFERAWGRLAR